MLTHTKLHTKVFRVMKTKRSYKYDTDKVFLGIDEQKLLQWTKNCEIGSIRSHASIRTVRIINRIWSVRAQNIRLISVVRQFTASDWFSGSHDIKISKFEQKNDVFDDFLFFFNFFLIF